MHILVNTDHSLNFVSDEEIVAEKHEGLQAYELQGTVKEVFPGGATEWGEYYFDADSSQLYDRESFFNLGKTAEQIAADLLKQRQVEANAECARRIVAVADPTAQINLAAAAAAGVLSDADMAIYKAGVAWIDSTRKAWPAIAADTTKEIADDNHWPAPTADMIALAAQY